MIGRRRFLTGSALGLIAVAGLGACEAAPSQYGDGGQTGTVPDDWPEWAEQPDAIFAKAADLGERAVSLAEFGAALDGETDDRAALERALMSDAPAILLPPNAVMRLDGQVTVTKGFALLGGPGARIDWYGSDRCAILVRPADNGPDSYVHGIRIDNISVQNRADGENAASLINTYNARGVYLTRNRLNGVSLAVTRHQRQALGLYKTGAGSRASDPAVLAGFSSRDFDDLSEDIYVLDNLVDYGRYQGSVLRFEFARRVVAWRNIGNYAKVSWWGGGARMKEGGAPEHLRRARQAYIADNEFRHANGGVYGNNGQHIVVARNRISDMTDVGVDFEGCMDCVAYENDIANIANFPFATFYAARNIEFRDNRAFQDGSAEKNWRRYGKGRYGSQRALYMCALRSAGFGKEQDAISIRFLRNRMEYTGPLVGACASSYFGDLVFEDNDLINVCSDWRYRLTGRLTIRGNRLRFDKQVPEPVALIAGAASETLIEDNVVTIGTALPQGTAVIAIEAMGRQASGEIRNNRLIGTPLPIMAGATVNNYRGEIEITNNQASMLLLDPEVTGGVAHSGNSDLAGFPLQVGPLNRMAPRYPVVG